MPEYLSPGVYVEEVDAGPKPIEGVSTSTAGAVGVTEKGPSEGPPVLVTSFSDFQRTFGDLLPEPDPSVQTKWKDLVTGGHFWRFPLAVKGFFDNGGQRLYVKRVVPSGATPASFQLKQSLFVDLRRAAAAGDTELHLAKVPGLAIPAGASVTLLRPDGSTLGPVVIDAYAEATGIATLHAPLSDKADLGTWLFGAPAAGDPDSLRFDAFAAGDWGNQVEVRLRPMVAANLQLLPNPVGTGNPSITTTLADDVAKDAASIELTDPTGFTPGDKLRINGKYYTLEAAFAITPHALEALPAGTLVQRMRLAVDAASPRVVFATNASRLYEGAALELDAGDENKLYAKVATVAGAKVTLDADLPTAAAELFHEGDAARLIEARCEVRYQPDLLKPAELEVHENLRLHDDGSPSYLVTRINQDSRFVRAAANPGWAAGQPDLSKFPVAVKSEAGWVEPTTAGADDIGSLSTDDFTGGTAGEGPGKRKGIAALEDIDDISLCMVPGIWAKDVRSALITHCESLRYRFAIVDPPPSEYFDIGKRLDPEAIKGPVDTKYAAIYYPWIKGRDYVAKRDVLLPPSGHIAGIYARSDVERGVHKAPANEVVRSISEFEMSINKREQDILNPKGVNALRYFPDRGFRVWGARTLSSDSSWKYVNVRRIFIFIEASIDAGTQWVVFEPNDEKLWSRVRASIGQFLETQWRAGVLQGVTRDEAFFVKCDRTTMTQDDIDNGRLICVIGIAPVKPAEFVIFRIQQKTLDQKA